MNRKKTEIGIVWQVLLTQEENEKLINLLTMRRLSPDKEGLKALILGKIDRPGEATLTPEMEGLLEKGMMIAGKWIKKKAGIG